MPAGAPLGNKRACKLKDKKTKDKVYKDYCDHIATGKSHKSWYYDNDGLLLTWETIESYIKNDTDFDPLHKKTAIAKSLAIWESDGKRMMEGLVDKCQPVIYQMFMRNKFGWDKKEPETSKATIEIKLVDYCNSDNS